MIGLNSMTAIVQNVSYKYFEALQKEIPETTQPSEKQQRSIRRAAQFAYKARQVTNITAWITLESKSQNFIKSSEYLQLHGHPNKQVSQASLKQFFWLYQTKAVQAQNTMYELQGQKRSPKTYRKARQKSMKVQDVYSIDF